MKKVTEIVHISLNGVNDDVMILSLLRGRYTGRRAIPCDVAAVQEVSIVQL